MQCFYSPKALQKALHTVRAQGFTLAFVPTMGTLHEGHLHLVREAQKKAQKVVVSLFVNPLQFGKNEDYKVYPKDFKNDLKDLKALGVDFVFMPSVTSVYPKDFQTEVSVKKMSEDLCGRSRPGHFKGVATIVLKLFNWVKPDVAVFGKKDYQQYLIIKALVKDLNLPLKILGAKIIRDKGGLALSSRNLRLSAPAKKEAYALSASLFWARQNVNALKPLSFYQKKIKQQLLVNPLIKTEYVEFRDAQTLLPLKKWKKGQTLLALAAKVDGVRLIDNVVF